MTVLPNEGALLSLEMAFPDVLASKAEPTESAAGARAWLVNVDEAMGRAWVKRFQRSGWAVSRFPSYAAAVKQLSEQPSSARPSLV